MEPQVPKEIYILICTGDERFFDTRFKATCRYAFIEDPINNPKYEDRIKSFIEDCMDETKLSCVVEGTEKLTSIKLQLI